MLFDGYVCICCCIYVSIDDILGVTSSHFSNQETGPLKTYDEMVKNGKLRLDKYQRSIVEQLQRLYNDVVNYQPDNTGFLRKVSVLP